MLAVSNVSGSRQLKTFDFVEPPDIPPGFAEPQQQERPVLPAHCEEYYFLARWFLCSEDCSEAEKVKNLLFELSPCDREEIRHQVSIQFWLKALSAEQRGKRPVKSAGIVVAMLKRELGKLNKLNQTVASVNHDEAKAAADARFAARLALLEAEHIKIASQERAAAKNVVVPVSVVRF